MQGTYLSSAALSHARENSLPEGQTLGNFNGEFWGAYASTQVQMRILAFVLHTSGVASIAPHIPTHYRHGDLCVLHLNDTVGLWEFDLACSSQKWKG
jgi:hypothetical protein